MAEPGTPDWWLDRLFGRLRKRRSRITEYDNWYSGDHPAPQGYEKAQPMLARLLESTGLNILPKLADAAHERMRVRGFKVDGQINDRIWELWQGSNFDGPARMIFQEQMALSLAYALVDPTPNAIGLPTLTPEHPDQCIVEYEPGSTTRAAGLKVWLDDLGRTPALRAMLYLPDAVHAYAAPTRVYAGADLAIRPAWEFQPDASGANLLGEVSLIEFRNRPRMLKEPRPEWWPALVVQRRINKTILDRMAMQDQGAFKSMWATGLQIPIDPATGLEVEPFRRAIDRLFVNEDPAGKFGQFEAEDIRQMLAAVEADVKHASIVVSTPPDQLLGEIVNVSEGGLKAARDSLARRVELHKDFADEPLEDLARLALKAAGDSVPNVSQMTTVWSDTEDVTLGAKADAAVKWDTLGVPRPALWERFLGADPQEIADWRGQVAAAASPLTALADAMRNAPTGG